MSCPLEAAPDQNLRLEIEEALEASTRRARVLNVGYVGEWLILATAGGGRGSSGTPELSACLLAWLLAVGWLLES